MIKIPKIVRSGDFFDADNAGVVKQTYYEVLNYYQIISIKDKCVFNSIGEAKKYIDFYIIHLVKTYKKRKNVDKDLKEYLALLNLLSPENLEIEVSNLRKYLLEEEIFKIEETIYYGTI